MKKSIVLHITPHLGGGVGKVLLNYFTLMRECEPRNKKGERCRKIH